MPSEDYREIANAYYRWNYFYGCRCCITYIVGVVMAHESEVIQTKGHPWIGVRWPVTGSRGDKYHVEMVNYGFECDCIAYRKCKHIKEVEKKITSQCTF